LDKNGGSLQNDQYDDTVNGDSWVDDVMFPSGHPGPAYISDWEWMFDVFETALEAQGITDGYALSLYYPGYTQTGDMFSAFGGSSPTWSINPVTGMVDFAATSESMKSYLECMRAWYANGWIDAHFAERSGDVFYRIDETSYRQGKVGFWMGTVATLGTKLYAPENPYTEGIVVYGAAQPINDVYGTEETRLKTPYTYFGQLDLVIGGIAVTDKAKDKDVARLCSFLDYLFTQEGSILATFGLSQEQQSVAKNAVYEKYGLSEGAYTPSSLEEGLYVVAPQLIGNVGNIQSAMTLNRMPHLHRYTLVQSQLTPTTKNSLEQWTKYPPTGFIGGVNTKQVSAEDQKQVAKISPRIEQEYMYVNVPKFIMGQKNMDSDWDIFCADLKKRNYQKITDIYNAYFQSQRAQ
jgi:hypothetical protein